MARSDLKPLLYFENSVSFGRLRKQQIDIIVIINTIDTIDTINVIDWHNRYVQEKILKSSNHNEASQAGNEILQSMYVKG